MHMKQRDTHRRVDGKGRRTPGRQWNGAVVPITVESPHAHLRGPWRHPKVPKGGVCLDEGTFSVSCVEVAEQSSHPHSGRPCLICDERERGGAHHYGNQKEADGHSAGEHIQRPYTLGTGGPFLNGGVINRRRACRTPNTRYMQPGPLFLRCVVIGGHCLSTSRTSYRSPRGRGN